jgi:hypothetical protein
MDRELLRLSSRFKILIFYLKSTRATKNTLENSTKTQNKTKIHQNSLLWSTAHKYNPVLLCAISYGFLD